MANRTLNSFTFIGRELERALIEARQMHAAKNFEVAAQKYHYCATLQSQLAEYAVNAEVKARQMQVASMYAGIAQRLGKQPDAQPPVAEAGNGHQEQVRMFIVKATTKWDDIGNLNECKQAIQAAYALALVRRPANVRRKSLDNILLYGPPGTGKTMLAAAASCELEATFFSVKVSELLSKWFGESSKLVSALYAEAARQTPSVVFLEEFDALAPVRGESDSGAERRIVSTLLAELDGLNRHLEKSPYVLTIAATNVPWLIDKPILERFGARQIYVPLPEKKARAQILHLNLEAKGYALEMTIEELARRSEGFSGRDLANLCAVAIERMELEANPEILQLRSKEKLQAYQLNIHPLNSHHFDYAFDRVMPRTTHDDLQRFERWRRSVEA
jgi:SpoVK/Ycf46/Vps4 family AAA+-type ATPase